MSRLFEDISESERQRVRAVINSLLSYNLLTREHDREKYLAARRHIDKIKEYFGFIGWEIVLDERYEYLFVASSEAVHRRSLDRDESIWLLVLRLLYEEKRKGLSISEYPMVTLREIRSKYAAFRLPPLKKSYLAELVRLAVQYRLMDALDDDIAADECRFRLFHTLLRAVDGGELASVSERLLKYQLSDKEEPDDEIVSQAKGL